MLKLILASILTFLSLSASAGTVTVNGTSCGSLTSMTLDAAGALVVGTDAACGVITPPPPPVEPPVEDPFACVPSANLNCITRPFPVIPQEIVSLYGSKVVAIKVRVPATGRGRISTMIYAGPTAARTVTLSTVPGEMTSPLECVKSGLEVTSNNWTTLPGVRGECQLPVGKDIYINIKASNCPEGTRCKIYLKAN